MRKWGCQILKSMALAAATAWFCIFQFFGTSQKIHENGRPKGITNHLKMGPWAPRGGPGGARDRLRQLLGCVLEEADF